VYFGAYSAILLVWPYFDPRFLLPVVPAVFAYGIIAVRPLLARPPARAIAALYCAVFIGLGALALGRSTVVSWSGQSFPRVFAGKSVYLDSYLAAFGQPHDETKVDQRVLGIIQRYETRARVRP
jgi:hypothetical protein